MADIIEVKNLRKTYGKTIAVDDVSLLCLIPVFGFLFLVSCNT